MSEQDEWGPWIQHDGSGVPTDIRLGDFVEVESEDNETGQLVRDSAIVTAAHLSPHNWIWGESTHDTLRYRIRKPRALQQLRDMIEHLPESEDA
jgi:hypothetical protein